MVTISYMKAGHSLAESAENSEEKMVRMEY